MLNMLSRGTYIYINMQIARANFIKLIFHYFKNLIGTSTNMLRLYKEGLVLGNVY